MNPPQKHVCVHASEVGRLLGLDMGQHMIRKASVDDGDYVHIILCWTGDGPAPDGYLHTAPGGYVDISPAPGQMPKSVTHVSVDTVDVVVLRPGDRVVFPDGREILVDG